MNDRPKPAEEPKGYFCPECQYDWVHPCVHCEPESCPRCGELDIRDEAEALFLPCRQDGEPEAPPEPPPPPERESVGEYFAQRLGASLEDPQGLCNVMSIKTPCGADCAKAIDAAAALLEQNTAAFGHDKPLHIVAVQQVCAQIVQCFVYG